MIQHIPYNPLEALVIITPTYYLLTFMFIAFGFVSLLNAYVVQEQKDMRLIVFAFGIVNLGLGAYYVAGGQEWIDTRSPFWREVFRVLLILELGGLASVLGVPVVLRLLAGQDDET